MILQKKIVTAEGENKTIFEERKGSHTESNWDYR